MLYKNLISKDLDTLKIFSLDSRLKNALVIFAFCCQVISGFTEWLGIAPFLIDLLKPFLDSTLSNGLGNVMALSLALFLEFLVFYLVGFIIHAIRANYWMIEGARIDKVFNQIKFWSASCLLAVLIFVSIFLSKRNVKYQIAATSIEIEQTDLDQYDTKQKEQTAAIESRYLRDKQDLDKSLKESKELIKNAYTAKINAIQGQINILVRKEQRTGQSYISKRTFYKKQIDQLRSSQADELHQLRVKYDSDLQGLKNSRNAAIDAIGATIGTDRTKAAAANDKTAAATEIRNNWISQILQYIASLSVLGFVVARSWVEMSDATAGIEEKAMPLQESQGSNFVKEFILLCRLSIQRRAQNAIRKKLANVPDLVPIEGKGAVFAFDTSLPHQKPKRDLSKLFGAGSSADVSDFTEFSKNKKSSEDITATVEINDPIFSEKDGSFFRVVKSNNVLIDKNKEVVSDSEKKYCLQCKKGLHSYDRKDRLYCSKKCKNKAANLRRRK